MKKIFCTVMMALAMSASVSAENAANSTAGTATDKAVANKYVPTEGNLAARSHFQDSKFGIFLHWGLYSMLATGEWTMTNNNLNYKEYAKQCIQDNPELADELEKLIFDALKDKE